MAGGPQTPLGIQTAQLLGGQMNIADQARRDLAMMPQGWEQPNVVEPPSMFLGEFSSGLSAGLRQLRTDAIAVRALATDVFGDEESTNELIGLIHERGQASQRDLPRTVQRVEDINSVGDFARFTSRLLGEQVPVIATIIAGGGASGLLGRMVGKRLINKQIATQLAARLPAYSAGAGAVATASGIETGATVEEQLAATGDIDPGIALGAGILKGSLEAIVPAALGLRFGLTPDLSRGLIGKLVGTFNRVVPGRLANVPALGLAEGLTETAQEVVDLAAREFVDENYELLGDESASRLLNAAASGALIGAIFGPLAGSAGPLGQEDAGATGEMLALPAPEGGAVGGDGAGAGRTGPEGTQRITGPQAPLALPAPDTGGAIQLPGDQIGLPDQSLYDVPQAGLTPEQLAQIQRGERPTDRLGLSPTALRRVQDMPSWQVIGEVDVNLPALREIGQKDRLGFSPTAIRRVSNEQGARNQYDGVMTTGEPIVSISESRVGAGPAGPTNLIFPTDEARLNAIETTPPAEVARLRAKLQAERSLTHEAAVDKMFLKDMQERGQGLSAHEAGLMVRDAVEDYRNMIRPDNLVFIETNGAISDKYNYPVNVPEDRRVHYMTSVRAHSERSHREHQQAERLKSFFEAAMKEHGIAAQLTFLYDEAVSENLGGYVRGHAFQDKDGYTNREVFTIFINDKKSEVDQMATAIHEFGHLLVYYYWNNTPSWLQVKVLEAYNRSKVNATSYDSFIQEFINPMRARRLDPTAQGATTDEIFKMFTDSAGYWYSFDEWMAEQTVRAQLSTVEPPMDAVAKWFKRLSGAVRGIIKTGLRVFSKIPNKDAAGNFKHRLKHFNAPREFMEWLDYIKRTGSDVANQRIAEMAEEAVRKQQLMDFVHDETVYDRVPRSATTVHASKLLSKMGVNSKLRNEVTAPADKFNWFIRLFWNLQQISSKNRHIPQLNRYVELVDRWYNFSMQWISMADQTLKMWMSLGRKQGKALSGFIFDIEAMNYLTLSDFEPRQPTDAEIATLAKKHGLTAAGLEVFERIKGDFERVFKQIEETTLRDINRTVQNPVVKERKLALARQEFAMLRKRPYFPHARFGDFAVVVRDEFQNVVHMEQFESHRAAKKAIRSIAKNFPDDKTIIRRMPKAVQIFRGLPASMLEIIRDNINKMQGIDEKAKAEFNTWIDTFIAELGATAGFTKKLAGRRGATGFSKDAMRSYANYFFHNAKHFARLEYGGALEREIADLTAANGNSRHLTDITKRDRIRDYMVDHFDYIMNPKEDWAALRSLAFQWWLGFSVQSAVLNFTQIPLVAYPYLASEFGDAKSVFALKKAALSIHKLYNAKPGAVPDDLRKALFRAVQEGVVDESQATELSGIAQGQYLSRFLPELGGGQQLATFAHWSGFMFQASEKINRRVVFRAAWELALKNNKAKRIDRLVQYNPIAYKEMIDKEGYSVAEARAYLAAKDAVHATQFQYAAHARPKFMHGKKGTLFAFFMFLQNMLWYSRHSPGNARFLLLLLAAGGIMGMPGGEDLVALAQFAGRNLFGKQFNVREEVRRFTVDLADGTIPPDLILLGASRYGFGMPAAMDAIGLPKAEFDLSANISMGQVVPGLTQMLEQPGLNFDEKASRVGTDIAGAAFGVGINLMKAMTDNALPIDSSKRWERAMPRALRNVFQAARYARTGQEVNRTGAEVISFDLSDPDHIGELALKAAGFSPTRLGQRWDREAMEREVEGYWYGQRQILMSRFDQSFWLGDADMNRDVISDIQDYNDRVPFGYMRITAEIMKRSRMERERARRLFEAGIGGQRQYIPLRRDLETLFPEVEDQPTIEPLPRA